MLHRWLLGVVLAAAALACRATTSEIPDVEPATYTSPDGEYALTVDPSRRDGGGEALYLMRRGGDVVWQAAHPFTLRKAVVADDGTSGGFGYSNGYEAFTDPGDLVVATLDPAGRPLHVDRIAREQGPAMHGIPEPVASGVLLQPAQRRFVVRVPAESGERWWGYALADGMRTETVAVNAPVTGARFVEAAHQVTGMPLTVMQWFRRRAQDDRACPPVPAYDLSTPADDDRGTTFALVDAEGRPVWMLHWRLRNDSGAHAIAGCDATGRFALRDGTTQIDYAVGADAQGGWAVREIARSDVPPVVKHTIAQVPAVAATPLGTIRLRFPASARAASRAGRGRDIGPDAGGFAQAAAMFVGRHGLYVVGQPSGAVHMFDRDGTHRRICSPDPGERGGDPFDPSLAVMDDGSLYVSRSGGPSYDDTPSFVHYDAECNRIGSAALGVDPVVQRWYAQPGTRRRWVLGYRNAHLVDRDGALLRRIDRRADGRWLQLTQTAAVAPDGSIAILSDGWGDSRISTYSADGTPLATWPVPRPVLPMDGRLAYDGTRVAVMVLDEKRTRSHLLVTDVQGRGGVRVGFDDPERALTIHLVDGELWVFDRRRTIMRYVVPELRRGRPTGHE